MATPFIRAISDDVTYAMYSYLPLALTLLRQALCVEIEITGELSFDMRISNRRGEEDDGSGGSEEDGDTKVKLAFKGERSIRPGGLRGGEQVSEVVAQPLGAGSIPTELGSGNVTAAPPAPECIYQYPETKQVNAMLSDMMNKLTRVFVRINKFMRTTRLREKEKRFKVVDKKHSDFFDQVFNNMSSEYRQFYKDSTVQFGRSARDPCRHQPQVKRLWRTLLDSAQSTYRRAALRCVDEYLRVQNRAQDPRTKNMVNRFLLKELGSIRASQLSVLCNTFQLCYNELL